MAENLKQRRFAWWSLICFMLVFLTPICVDTTNLVNVALRKPTQHIQTDHGGGPEKAVDGNRNPNFYAGSSCSHTIPGPKTWWAVDLLSSYDVHSITITNRFQFPYRLANFQVYVSDVYPLPIPRQDGTFVGQMCFSSQGAYGSSETKTENCSTVINGRYVYIFKPDTDPLTLCEFEVMAPENKIDKVRMERLVGRIGMKSLVPPFYSTIITIPSRLKCAAVCLSRNESVTTAIQFDETTTMCQCLQKSRLTSSGSDVLDPDWSTMELSDN